MEKIVDAQMIEKELEKINSFLGCRKKVNESRVQKRTFSKRGLFSLWSLDMISGHENYPLLCDGLVYVIFDRQIKKEFYGISQ